MIEMGKLMRNRKTMGGAPLPPIKISPPASFAFWMYPVILSNAGFPLGEESTMPRRLCQSNAHDWTQEVAEILRRTNFDFRDLLEVTILEAALPQRCRHVQPRESRALLALVLKGSTNGLQHRIPDFRRLVDHMKVFPA